MLIKRGIKSFFTIWANYSSLMVFKVCSKFEIFNSIIISDSINMMGRFALFQISTKKFLHNKPMLRNISRLRSKGMFAIFDHNISPCPYYTASLPSRIFIIAVAFTRFFSPFFRITGTFTATICSAIKMPIRFNLSLRWFSIRPFFSCHLFTATQAFFSLFHNDYYISWGLKCQE